MDSLDSYTVKVSFTKPQPYWDLVFTGGGLLPRHVFARYKGAGAREAVGNVKAVGTGPYRLVDFKPGDLVRAEINPLYHVPNRPFFDRLEIKGGGDAVSAARAVLQTGEYDFAYYILAEEEVLRRVEQGGKGRIVIVPGAGVSHIQCNQTDPWREVDGERSSVRTTHPSLSDPAVRRALNLLVDRGTIQDHLVGRSGRIADNFLLAPHRCRSTSNTWEFSVNKAGRLLDEAGWVRGVDGIRSKGAQRLKLVFQAGAAATVQKVQAVVKQAAARAGIEVEVKAVPLAVYFSADTNNPDTNVRFHADLQMYTVFGGLDPQLFMAQFVSWEIPTRDNKWTGRNLTRWRNADYDRLWREADSEMDPVKRAGLFINMNDMVVQDGVVIPITQRNILHATSHQIEGFELNGWDSIFGNIAYWYRRGSVTPRPAVTMTASVWSEAIERMRARVDDTAARVRDGLPHWADTDTGAWTTTPDGDWTGGYWIGMLWLAATATGDARYREWAAPRRSRASATAWPRRPCSSRSPSTTAPRSARSSTTPPALARRRSAPRAASCRSTRRR